VDGKTWEQFKTEKGLQALNIFKYYVCSDGTYYYDTTSGFWKKDAELQGLNLSISAAPLVVLGEGEKTLE
jgi:hypothetical protein